MSLERGVLADLPLPGREKGSITPYAEAAPADRARPWFFDEATARAAQAFAATDWNAQTAMPSINAVSNCVVEPFSFNSVTTLKVSTDSDFDVRPIPLGAKFPLEITVAAWQWGRPQDPKIKIAGIVRRMFRLIR